MGDLSVDKAMETLVASTNSIVLAEPFDARAFNKRRVRNAKELNGSCRPSGE